MQFKSYCYFVSSSIKTWHQAQAYCKGLGGELVKINSNEAGSQTCTLSEAGLDRTALERAGEKFHLV